MSVGCGFLIDRIFGGFQQISFARTRSDAVVKSLDAENLDEHKAQRAEHKSECMTYPCANNMY